MNFITEVCSALKRTGCTVCHAEVDADVLIVMLHFNQHSSETVLAGNNRDLLPSCCTILNLGDMEPY